MAKWEERNDRRRRVSILHHDGKTDFRSLRLNKFGSELIFLMSGFHGHWRVFITHGLYANSGSGVDSIASMKWAAPRAHTRPTSILQFGLQFKAIMTCIDQESRVHPPVR
jgi:hypothetical protein